MKALSRYTVVSSLIVALIAGITVPFLDAAGRLGFAAAGVVALPLQVGLFALLVHARDDSSRFMTWWGLGVLGRVVAVAAVGLGVRSFQVFDPTVTMMATVGLFYIFLLLEPVFLRRDGRATEYA
ncbi:MAG: hypothetical protein U5R14_04580 [Gemmatimonadota bacterium]|nr:hypothetical protein [Gemmatimonadota bacterium]